MEKLSSAEVPCFKWFIQESGGLVQDEGFVRILQSLWMSLSATEMSLLANSPHFRSKILPLSLSIRYFSFMYAYVHTCKLPIYPIRFPTKYLFIYLVIHYPFIYPFSHPSYQSSTIHQTTIHLSMYLYIYLFSVSPCVYIFIYLPIHLFIYSFTHVSIYLVIHSCIHLFIYPSVT